MPNPPDLNSMLQQAFGLLAAGRTAEAANAFSAALAVAPSNASALAGLGQIAAAGRRDDNAEALLRQSVNVDPMFGDAWNLLGVVLRRQRRLPEALDCLRRAVELLPGHAGAHYNLANTLADARQLDDAAAAFRRAIMLQPAHADARINLAKLFKDQGRIEESIALLRDVLRENPGSRLAGSNLILTLQLSPAHGEADWLAEAQTFAALHCDPLTVAATARGASSASPRAPGEKLRLGYVSADFRMHPIGLAIEPILRHHDRGAFQVTCYSNVTRTDEHTDLCRKHVDQWYDTRELSDEKLAERIREDRIDILVDLTLHLVRGRPLMFARRPAPVQVGYLAYPASSGMRAHDFRITDLQLDPPENGTPIGPENALWLPHSYLCYRPAGDWPEVRGEPPCASNGYVTFGALNNFSKNNAETLRLWACVLDAVARSRLVLVLRGGLEASPSMRERFRAAALDSERVTVLDRAPSRRDYLNLFNSIDIALDPVPYSGHTTAFDALLMGVPIVALRGASALGRGGVTALHQVGLDDLVARDANDYVNLAASLASDPARLTNLRHELRPRLLGSPAADAAGVTRSLEELYQQMWRAHGGGDAC